MPFEGPVDLDKPVLRRHQRKALEAEIEAVQAQLADPHARTSFRSGGGTLDPRAARKAVRQNQQMLDTQAPDPNPEPHVRDYLARKVAELEARIKEGMPTQYEMRSNPPGSVAKHMKWERGKKRAILQWKNAKVRLEPDSDDPDLANVEILRHPGHRWVPTDAYRAGFDRIMWGQVSHDNPEGLEPLKVYACVDCGREFRNKPAHKVHARTCKGEGPAPAEAGKEE